MQYDTTEPSSMNALYDTIILKDVSLAAEILWSTTSECFRESNEGKGLSFQAIFLVLPMIFHKSSSEILAKIEKTTPLETILNNHPEILTELQQRIVFFSERTLRALNICFVSDVLKFDPKKDELFPGTEEPIVAEKTGPVPLIVAASKSLGRSFSGLSAPELGGLLHIKFEK